MIDWIFDHLFVFVGGIIALILTVMVLGYFNTETHNDCVIAEKDRVSKSEGGSEMRVYTDNCGTFVVSDDIFMTDFSSADRYGKIKVGETYDITSYGFRLPFFSMFPKIKEAELVK